MQLLYDETMDVLDIKKFQSERTGFTYHLEFMK